MALPRTSAHASINLLQQPSPSMDPESSGMVTEDDMSQLSLSPSASTPNLLETVDQIKRSLSIATLHDLSHRPSIEVRRSIQKKIWRPHDDEAKLPADWERLVIYVFRAGSRAFMLSYGLRGTLSFLLTIAKSLRSRRPIDKKQLKLAFVGEDTVRLALAVCIWASIYKFVNNALRLLTPYPKPVVQHRIPMRRTRTAPAATFKLGGMDDHCDMHEKATQSNKEKEKELHQKHKLEWKHLSTYDPRVRSWHAYVAGAASSLAFFVESKSVVRSLTLQIFVRGLEGTYRHARANGMPGIPHGEVLAFGLANIQIIMSWLGAPQYLDRGYRAWIDKASDVPKPTLQIYLSHAANKIPDPWALVALFGGTIPEPVSENPRVFADLPPNKYAPEGVSGKVIERVYNWMDHGHLERFPNCGLSHVNTDNHFYATYQNFSKAWKFIMPVYMTLYFVPALFLRTKVIMKTPKSSIIRMFLDASRSSAFLATYVVLVKSAFCLLHGTADRITFSSLNNYAAFRKLSSILADHKCKAIAGFISCLSLFVEHKRRRSELTAYVLPKAFESFWKSGRARGILPRVPYGDYILGAASMSMIMGTFAHNPENLSKLVSLVIYQLIGRN